MSAVAITSWQAVGSMPAFPSVCRVCGGGNLPAIDTLLDGDTGHVYLCGECVRKTAAVADAVPREQFVATLEQLEKERALRVELEQSVADLAALNERLEKQLEDAEDAAASSRAREEIVALRLAEATRPPSAKDALTALVTADVPERQPRRRRKATT